MFTLPPLPREVTAAVITRNNRLIGRDTVEATVAWQWLRLAGVRAALLTDTPPTAEMSVAAGFTVDPAALATLRDAPFSLRADAEIRFQSDRIAGELPLRAGSALEVAGQRVEVLAVEALPPIVLVRYTRVPDAVAPTWQRAPAARAAAAADRGIAIRGRDANGAGGPGRARGRRSARVTPVAEPHAEGPRRRLE